MSERARWEALADALATDESLSEEERAFVDAFDDGEGEVDRERALYSTLAEHGRPAPVLPADRQRAEATLAEFRRRRAAAVGLASEVASASEHEPAASPRRRGVVVGVIGTVCAAAAAMLLWVGLPAPTVVTLERPDAVVTGGTLMLDEVELGSGDGIPLGRWVRAKTEACVDAGRSRGCVGPGTRLRIDRDGYELSEGELHLQGTATVVTPAGSLRAEAADVVLDVEPEGVSVEPTAGAVTVPGDDGSDQVLGAGDRARLGEPVVLAHEDSAEPEGTVEPEPSTEAEPSAEIEPETNDTPETEAGPKPSRPSAATPGELLSAARRQVAEGSIGKALSAYAALRRQHPRSPEAHAANVSIGELELRRGRAKAALGAFDRYLARGGPLSEEAHWGRIRALHRMGKTERRDAAIEALRAAHPSSVYLARASSL